LVANLVGLQEKPAALIGRVVLCSALIDAVSVAPALMIVGPDTARGNRLVELLHCMCRNSLRLTGATAAGFCSLPSGMRFTYLLSQSSVSGRLGKLLDDASTRDRKIPSRGGLLDLFGVQVIHSDSAVVGDSWPLRSIEISMMPTAQELPMFNVEERHRITDEFQAKLLNFRRANLSAAHELRFDASKFAPTMRDLARSIAAATPGDIDLQAEVFDLLRERDAEIRSEQWIALDSVAVEAVLVAGYESPDGVVYVAHLAEIVQEIMIRRGGFCAIDPGAFGKRLKFLGFTTERDAKGKKMRLTEAVRIRAEHLTRDLDGPEIGNVGVADTCRQENKG
jgi:hypothetical protein